MNPENIIGACPDEWVSGGGEPGYSEGDLVAVSISTDPELKVAYRCKAFPFSMHCGQYSPEEFGGDQGWSLAGGCDGSMGPTSSPVFESLTEIGDGCPEEYSSSVGYEAGGQVAVTMSDSDVDRKIVYECQNYPHSGYCKDQPENLAPGEEFGYLGWSLKGHCEGTISPTLSPSKYDNEWGVCKYNTCETFKCTPGSSGCSCGANSPSGAHCTKTVCNDVPVDNYSSSKTYKAGDVVRIADKRFKCKGHPFTGWCSVSAYAPMLERNELWPQAWTEDGTCPSNQAIVVVETSTENITTTVSISSSLTLAGLTLPTDSADRLAAKTAIEDTIKALVEASLDPSQSVQGITITSIGGVSFSTRNRALLNKKSLRKGLVSRALTADVVEYSLIISQETVAEVTKDTDGNVLSTTVDGQVAEEGASSESAINTLVSDNILAQVTQKMQIATTSSGGSSPFVDSLKAIASSLSSAVSDKINLVSGATPADIVVGDVSSQSEVVVTTGPVARTCPLEAASLYSEVPPSLNDLEGWTAADYAEGEGISGGFKDKKYMYNSAMVLDSGENDSPFRADYELTNARTTYPIDGSSPGVPGAYPYDEGYELWGGDDVKLGKQRYSTMIAHFGHTHILTVIGKINILRRDPCAETTSQDMMMSHLLDGSKQIFAKFAGLVDNDGNMANFGPNPPEMIQNLAGLMSMLIFGIDPSTSNPLDGGVISTQALFGGLEGLAQAAATMDNENAGTINAEANRVGAFLADVLNLDTENEIPFKAWYQLMDEHQGHTFSNFLRYRDVYRTPESDDNYQDLVDLAEDEMQALLQTGPQMAAFFAVFYSFVNVLDKFYVAGEGDEYAIPFGIMDDNINYVQDMLKTRWIEHVVMFNDHSKAAALDDEAAMFDITLNMLDSCTPLATAIGEIFYRFDTLIRGRGVYAHLLFEVFGS